VRPTNPQRRTIINWLVKYPDTVCQNNQFLALGVAQDISAVLGDPDVSSTLDCC
jgi:hypothetical protein